MEAIVAQPSRARVLQAFRSRDFRLPLAAPGTIIALGACVSMSIVGAGLLSARIRTVD